MLGKSKDAVIYFVKGNLKMKKLLTALFAICIAASVTACNVSDEAPKKETNTSAVSDTSSQKAQEETFGLNETAAFKSLKVTAVKLEESTGKDFFTPGSGKVFVGVNFEIENTSDETQTVSSLLLFDAYADNVKCDYSLTANTAFGNGTLDGELSPGKKLVGWYAVEVPQEWKQLEFEVKSDWLSNSKAKFVFNK